MSGNLTVATVVVDSNPQALMRFNKSVEEKDQVALWTDRPQDAPQMLTGIGRGADWIEGEKLMLSTDGSRLVSVELNATRHAKPTARAVALAVLAAK